MPPLLLALQHSLKICAIDAKKYGYLFVSRRKELDKFYLGRLAAGRDFVRFDGYIGYAFEAAETYSARWVASNISSLPLTNILNDLELASAAYSDDTDATDFANALNKCWAQMPDSLAELQETVELLDKGVTMSIPAILISIYRTRSQALLDKIYG